MSYIISIRSTEKLSSNCPSSYFLCSNKKCQSPSTMCDGVNDCGDSSDETIGCNGMFTSLIDAIYHISLLWVFNV